MSILYSPGIKIADQRMSNSGSGFAALTGKKKAEFRDATRASLDYLKTTAIGAQLLGEIDASGKVVTIYRTRTADDGNCEFGDDPDTSMVVPLTERHGKNELELHVVLDRACADVSNRSSVQKFFKIGRAKHRFLSRDALGRLVGISGSDLNAMEAGKKAIPPIVDQRLRVYLYDFLTPGAGSDCGIQFNHTRDNLSPDHKRYLPATHHWMNRPPAIALGHELIHAWRCMVGRVLFDYGWEEEAMTVGLPPFSNMPYTENHIRSQTGNLAIRPDYQHIGIKTDLIRGTEKIGIDKDGDRSWQGNQNALHVHQDVAQAMSSRRKALGYADEDEDDGF